MPSKRFTEEEARRIFARVAERQLRAAPYEPGLSLAEMQEAARASGLDPALVAAVASEMSAGQEEDEIPTFWGAPLTVRKTRVLPVSVDDEGWADVVGVLRQQFGMPGVPSALGRQREWTSSTGAGALAIHFTLLPTETGTTLTLEQTVAPQSKGSNWILPLTVIPMAVFAALAQLLTDAGPKVWALPALIGGLMVIILSVLRITWGSWASRTDRQFERTMDRIEIAARDRVSAGLAAGTTAMGSASPSASADTLRQPALDLLGLADDAEDDAEGSARDAARRTPGRARS